MGKEKKRRKGHAQAIRKRQNRLNRIRVKKIRRLAIREAEWVDNSWDKTYPKLFEAKFRRK